MLRCLVSKKRGQNPDQPTWDLPNLLFICLYDDDGFTFAHFKGDKPFGSHLSTFSWHPGEPIRTICEYNLENLKFDDKWTADKWVEEWQKAFDVEKVNKRFYEKIAKLYYRLTGKDSNPRELKLPSQGENSQDKDYEEFAVRLIGRTIFCWFLKHKKSDKDVPLIPSEVLSLAAVNKNPDYYHSILEPLFFEVMNKEQPARKHLNLPKVETIPFLNGGLFESHTNDFYNGTPAYSLKIPDKWFIDFFTLLEQYNFTIDENSSIDIDVSVDPEMLGRVFENLLAEVVPETGETARKATGSYYTPRVIVDYMVEQSLKQYLLTKTKLGEDKINCLLAYGEDIADFPQADKLAVVKALTDIKIIDPACGSGAFPIGVLHRMLMAMEKVDPRLELWRKQYLDALDPMVRQTVEKNIRKENWVYIRKLMIIRDSIYGVDIQPIAVEIAKLRCFLSLVVDEMVADGEPNRGIESLPNLEFKFVAANTLIGLPPKIERQGTLGVSEHIQTLKKLRDKYLRSSGKDKKDIEQKFRHTQKKLQEENAWLLTDSEAKQLAEWDPFSYESNKWFDPEWMFGVVGGFDVVLANPPYVSAVEHSKSDPLMREIYRRKYPLLRGAFDLYCVFLLRGDDLCKSDACFTRIIPNKFLITEYAKDIQDYLIKNGLRASVDVSVYDVFESTGVYPIIIIGNKCGSAQFTKYKITQIDDLSDSKLIISDDQHSRNCMTFKDLGIKISSGTTGFQASQIINYLSEVKSASVIPFVVSGAIDRYCLDFTNIRYMGKKYSRAYIRKGRDIADSKWSFWNEEKIVIAGMTKQIEAYYSNEPLALGVGVYAIHDYAGFSPKFLTGILNSRYLSYYLNVKFKDKHLAGGYLAINKTTIEQLPLVRVTSAEQKPIIEIVDKIIKFKIKDPNYDTSMLEYKIDQLVYQLYGLTPEEIAIVEGKIK